MRTINNSFIRDLIIACLVMSLPFIFYLHRHIPEVRIWDTYFFSIHSHYYEDVNYLMWIFANKALVFVGFLIWYLTNKLWWKNTILVPLLIVLIQILSLFDDSKTQFDEIEYFNIIPIAFIFIVFIYWFGSKLKYYSLTQSLEQDLNNEIEREITKLSNDKATSVNLIREKLIELSKKKSVMERSEYLFELFELKKSIIDA